MIFVKRLMILAFILPSLMVNADDIELLLSDDIEGELLVIEALDSEIDQLIEIEALDSSEVDAPQLPEATAPEATVPEPTTPQVAPAESTVNSETTNKVPAPQNMNIVEVNEYFFKLIQNKDTGKYDRSKTNEAKPGDMIELVVQATNKSDQIVEDVELVNSIPNGPVTLLRESFNYDKLRGNYSISRNGKTFFPSEAELATQDIHFIQWVIFKLVPGETIEMSYRITINE